MNSLTNLAAYYLLFHRTLPCLVGSPLELTSIYLSVAAHSKPLTRIPESSAKSLIQVVAISIQMDFGSFYPEIGSGI